MGTFDAASTTDDVLEGHDLSGQVVVVTGSSSGLGEESSRALAAKGARVAMLARNPQANAEAVGRIVDSVPGADLVPYTADLADLASIADVARQMATDFERVDVLLNNAGVMSCPEARTSDGFEMQFGTNHLGHFALTLRLLGLLRASQEPRVVTVSSGGHRIADVDLDDPNWESTPYDSWVAYGRSKSANAHFAAELARRTRGEILSLAAHPGAIATNLTRHMTPEMIDNMIKRAKAGATKAGATKAKGAGFSLKSVAAGAATQVWACVSPDLVNHNGRYLADCAVASPGPGEKGYADWIDNPATAAKLWNLSERLVGLTLHPT